MSKLIIVMGRAGSGKTTVGKKLTGLFKNFTYLDKDTLCSKFVDHSLSDNCIDVEDRDCDLYRHILRPLEYETLYSVTSELLSLGVNVIISASMLTELSDYKVFASNFPTDTEFFVVKLNPGLDIEYERLEVRNLPRDAYKLKHWESYVQGLPEISIDLPFKCRELNFVDGKEDLYKVYNWVKAYEK